MNRKWTWMVRAVLLAVPMCVLLCPGMGAIKTLDSGLPPGWRRVFAAPTEEEKAIAGYNLKVNFHMADVSLEVREQVDFLLTPALLVQEAVSDGIVLTYPEE